MNFGRSWCAAAVMNGCIFVAGGGTDLGESKSVEKYDLFENQWINLAPMNKKRSYFTLATSGSFLYSMGSDEIVERYDPLENEWHMVCRSTRHNIMMSNTIIVTFVSHLLLQLFRLAPSIAAKIALSGRQ